MLLHMSAGDPRATKETPVRGEVATDPDAPPAWDPSSRSAPLHAPALRTSGRGHRAANITGLAVLMLGAAN